MAEPTLLDQYSEPAQEAPAAAGRIERAPAGYEPNPSQPTMVDLYGEDLSQFEFMPGEAKAKETAIGVGEGLVTGTGFTASALKGGTEAARVLAPMRGVHPIFYGTAVGTAALGSGIFGSMVAEEINDQIFPELSNERLLPYREGGKTFGESIAAAPFAFGLPVSNANRVARFVSQIGETARKGKTSYLIGETGAATTASLAGGAAVSYDPEGTGTRFAAEVVGGVLNPTRLFADAVPKVRESLTALKSSVSMDAKQQRAADRIVKLLDESGEDIPTLIKNLQEELPIDDMGGIYAGVKPTSAQKTGSDALTLLETTLTKQSPKLAAEINQQGQLTIQAYRLLVQQLSDIGNPNALRLAAEFRRDMHESMIANRVINGERRAAEKIANIKVDNASTRREVGDIVRTSVDEALSDARAYESALWRRAEQSRQVRGAFRQRATGQRADIETPNLAEEFLDIASTITPERFDALPKQVRDVMSRLGVTKEHIALYTEGRNSPAFFETGVVPFNYRPGELKPTTPQDLIAIRGDLLELARKATVAGDSREANFYSRMAQAAYDDIDKGLVGPEYDEARSFSRTLNDYFTRSYASDVLSQTRKGKQLPPEILVQKAFGANADLTSLRMEQIEDAVGMMAAEFDEVVKRYGADSVQADLMRDAAEASRGRIVSVRDAHDKVLRVAANKLMKTDPATGQTRIDPMQLQKFVDENQKMLRHVGLYDDMTDVVRAETALRNIAAKNNYVERNIRKQMAFAKVLGEESATDAVARVFRGKSPATDLRRIATMAKRYSQGAADGLKSTIFDYAFTKAGGANNFSPQAFDDAFFAPISPGLPSVFQVLQVEGIMSTAEGQNLRKLMRPMELVERAMGNQQQLDELLTGADAATELALRIVGAKAGTTVSGQGSQSLIAASAGSKYLRQLFDKAPTMMTRGIIEEASKDPKLMAELLKRGKSVGAKDLKAFEEGRLARLNSYLIGLGLRPPSMAAVMNAVRQEEAKEEMPMPPEAPIKRPQASRMLQELPTAPTRGIGQPAPQQTAQAAPAPAAPPTDQGAAQGTSREMLQRLFPMDTMLS
jgi:hypothetical protein